MISPLAYVSPDAKIGANVEIKPFAYIDSDVEIGDNCVIEPYASILPGTRMGKNNHVYSHAVLGADPQDFHYEPNTKSYLIIGDDNDIRENVVIARSIHKDGKAVIGNGNALMDKVHICHDVKLGNRCVLGINVSVAGDCVIEDCSIQSSGAVIQQRVRVGRYSLVQSGCRVQNDVRRQSGRISRRQRRRTEARQRVRTHPAPHRQHLPSGLHRQLQPRGRRPQNP